jgi:hypothetical protein
VSSPTALLRTATADTGTGSRLQGLVCGDDFPRQVLGDGGVLHEFAHVGAQPFIACGIDGVPLRELVIESFPQPVGFDEALEARAADGEASRDSQAQSVAHDAQVRGLGAHCGNIVREQCSQRPP